MLSKNFKENLSEGLGRVFTPTFRTQGLSHGLSPTQRAIANFLVEYKYLSKVAVDRSHQLVLKVLYRHDSCQLHQ